MRKSFSRLSAVFILLAGVWFLFSTVSTVNAAEAGCIWTASSSRYMNDLANWIDPEGNPCPNFYEKGLRFEGLSSADAYNYDDFYFKSLTVSSDYGGTVNFVSGNVSSTNYLHIYGNKTVNFLGGTMQLQGPVRILDDGFFNGAEGTGSLKNPKLVS